MKVKGRFDHFNINVTDLDKSIKFYETALGLHESHRKEASVSSNKKLLWSSAIYTSTKEPSEASLR